MQLQFDKSNLHLQVVCGILEEFKPTEEIKGLHERLTKLKIKLIEFQEQEIYPELTSIMSSIDNINKQELKKGEKKSEEKCSG